MDDWAEGFGKLAIISITVIVIFFAIIGSIIGSFIAKRYLKKDDKYLVPKRNAIISLTFFILISTFFYKGLLGSDDSLFFAVYPLIIAVILFCLLQILELLKTFFLPLKHQ